MDEYNCWLLQVERRVEQRSFFDRGLALTFVGRRVHERKSVHTIEKLPMESTCNEIIESACRPKPLRIAPINLKSL